MSKRSDTSPALERTPKPPVSSRAPGTTTRAPSSSPDSGGDARRPGRSRNVLPAATRASGGPARRNSKSKAVHGNKAKSSASNNSPAESPRASFSRASEPAIDEEPGREGESGRPSSANSVAVEHLIEDPAGDIQMDLMERQAVRMLHKITKKSEKNQQRYTTIHENMTGHSKRMDELHASYEDLTRQAAELQVICNAEMDVDTIDELYMSIPSEQRLVPLGEP